MTKNERNMLELALGACLLDNVLQGDSWGMVGDGKSPQEVFMDLSRSFDEYADAEDDQLLEIAKNLANEDPLGKFVLDDFEPPPSLKCEVRELPRLT